MITMEGIRWQRANSLEAAQAQAPRLSGVYAIAKASCVANLPISLEWVYVGRTKNLRRRLDEHGPIMEKHEQMRDWIIENRDAIETWFALLDGETSVELEKLLVRDLRPCFNRIRYSSREYSPGNNNANR